MLLILEENELDKNELNIYPNMQLSNFYLFNQKFFCPCFKVLRDILKEVQGNMVPRSMLKEWALHTFPNATDYWTFRKMFTIQLALIGLAEFMLHLNRLNPEMLQIAQVPE